MKQIIKVLEVMRSEGCNHTVDISDVTGLSRPVVATLLSELCRAGLIKRTDRRIPGLSKRGYPTRGHTVYEIAGGAP